MEEDDFGLMEIADVSMDEEEIQSNFLQSIFTGDKSQLLINARKIMNTNEESNKFKHQVHKLSIKNRFIFTQKLYDTICQIITEAIQGKIDMKQLFDANFFEFVFLMEKPKISLSEKLHQKFLDLLKITKDLGYFHKLLKYSIKITRSIDKNEIKEQFICKLHKLLIGATQKQKQSLQNSQFAVFDQLLKQENSDDIIEKQLLIKLTIMDFLNTSQNPIYKPAEQDIQNLLKVVYSKPLKGVLQYALKNHKLNSLCRKFRNQILSCGIMTTDNKLQYTFENCKIHKDLLNNESILELAIQNADQNIFRTMKKQLVIIHENQILFKYTAKMLRKMKPIIKNETFSPSQESLYNLLDLVKIFANNLDKKFRTPSPLENSEMKDEKEEQNIENVEIKKFFAQLVYIFSKYFMNTQRVIEVDMQIISQKLTQKTIAQLLNIALNWIKQYPNAEFTSLYTLNLVSLLAHLFIRQEYGLMTNYNSDQSILIRKVLTEIKSFTNQWKNFKKIKIILERWGETAPPTCVEYSSLVRKFLNFYFDEKTILKNVSRSIFSPLLASKSYMVVVGNQAGKIVYEILETQAKPNESDQISQQQLLKINQYLYKFSFFYSARIRLPLTDKSADLMYKLYQRYAHRIPLLYNLRTWIINYSSLSKDDASVEGINVILNQIRQKETDNFFKTIRSLSNEDLLASGTQNSSNRKYLQKIRRLINNMQIKSHFQKYEFKVYDQCIALLKDFNDLTSQLYGRFVKHFSKQEQPLNNLQKYFFTATKSLYRQIQSVSADFTNVFRFYLCNLNRLIDSNDQVHLLKASAKLFTPLAGKIENIQLKDVLLVNNIYGYSTTKPATHLLKTQIMKSSMHRYGGSQNSDQFLMVKEQFIPINIIAVVYQQIRQNFVPIIRNMISIVEEKELKKQQSEKNKKLAQLSAEWASEDIYSIESILIDFEEQKKKSVNSRDQCFAKYCGKIIKNIMFPTINTFGPCYFNNILEEKGKQQHAFGIYLDQFTMLYTDFTSREIANLSSQVMLILDACHLKDCIITNKQGFTNNSYRNRPFEPNRRLFQQITRELVLMGISQQYVQIALENVQNPDPDSVFDWIQSNPEKIAIEQSRKESLQGMSKNINVPQNSKQLQLINYNDFKMNVNKGTKKLTKKLFLELYSEKGNLVKDILFICMDSFKDEPFRKTKYEELTQKFFQEVDQLNREFSSHKLSIIVGSLQHIISKQPSLIVTMHQKCITLKLLSFIEKTNQEVGQKILQVINKTLPMPTQKCTQSMIQYLMYISDVLMSIEIKSDTESQILYKMTKACHQELNKKVLAVVCRGLGKGYIKNQIFSLLSIVLQSDTKFAEANIEFDVKSFIIENVDIQKSKNNLLEVDAKKFSRSFLKFENSENLNSVCKKFFFKKKNRTNLFFDKDQHPLYYSQILGCSFLSYDLSLTQRIIISNMVNLIVNCQKNSQQIKYIEELYKTLQFYKILIPYCMQIKVEGMTFFEWMLRKQFPKGRGDVICFLTFLLVRNGLFLDKQTTFSDYLISTVIKNFAMNQQLRQQKWQIFVLMYFLQIKNFNQKARRQISKQNKTNLKQILESSLKNNLQPVQYALISQSLYLIYQNQLIESLLKKYKINDSGQFTLEKQFLNMDLFYFKNQKKNLGRADLVRDQLQPISRRLSIIRSDRNAIILGIDGNQEEEMFDDQADATGILRHLRRTLNRDLIAAQNSFPIFVPRQESQSEQIIEQVRQNIMEEQKPNQGLEHKQQKKQVEKNVKQQLIEEVYLEDILQKFSKILVEATHVQSHSEQSFAKMPKQALKASDLEQTSYNISIKEPRTLLDQKFSKTNIFKERIKQISTIVDPKGSWTNHNEQTKVPHPQQLRAGGSQENGLMRQYMQSRLGIQRQRRNQGNDQIHMGKIFTLLLDYDEVHGQKQRQRKQSQKIEEALKKEEQQSLKKVDPLEMKDQKQQMENKQQQKEEKVQKVEEKMQQQNINNKQEDNKQVKPQKSQQIQQQQQQIKEQMIPQNQQIPAQQGNQVEPPQIPIRQRQILHMLGLPQTFLIDCGLDQQLFDSLPEDMQIQQLNHFMQTQRVNQQQQQSQQNNNSGEGGQENNPALNLQNQNAAFIASLDPQLRAQTLMEATPQFLMTLPAEMRAEAQNHRQRFIGRMIENQQLEEQEEIYSRNKIQKELKYPQIREENFPDIEPEAAKQLSKNILIRFPKFNIQGIRILLENKKTQIKAVNTLISYARNISTITLKNFKYNEDNEKWEGQEINPSGAVRKFFMELILETLYENTSKCIYKDANFLKGKAHYESYCEQKIPINEALMSDEKGYYPLYQILDLCFDNSQYNFAADLMIKVQALPTILKKKIIKGFRDERFPIGFYKNLKGLSQDQEMKSLFHEQFPQQKPPKYQILTKLLKYQFGKVSYLKKLHSKALNLYKQNPTPQLSEFLSQIFTAYTIADVKELEQILLEHKQSHFQIIKYFYSKGRVLDKQPIGLILQLPHLLDFETKRFIFHNNPKLNRHRSRLMIQVNRRNLFMESYNQIMSHTARQLQHRVKVQFIDEPAEDAGGVKKQWYLEVSRQIFKRQYALFEPSESGNTYQPNPKSYVNPEHLNYYKFIGRFTAKALSQGMLIDAFFTGSFYKMILGQKLELKDLEQQDYNLYKSMLWLKQNPIQEDQYTFSYVLDYFGKLITKQLVPGGQKISVNEENKLQYIEKYSSAIMRDSISAQIEKFLEGFYQVLPKQYISFFEAKQLELLMSGMPSIDLNDLKENIEYAGYQSTDKQIKWFWEILEDYSNEELAHLIQFITGTSKIPLQGFAEIQGMNGIQKISIHRDSHTQQLPRSHTCFNQLDLPAYQSKQVMKQKLRIVITWGSAGFGFM